MSIDVPYTNALSIGRRRFLGYLGASGAALAFGPLSFVSTSHAAGQALWSNPATWRGKPPGPGDIAVIKGTVILDQDARVGGMMIEPNGKLVFKTSKRVTLESSGNVVVRGDLVMQPKAADKVHRLVFVDVDETRFIGDGMEVLDSDVGLWVVGSGRLNLRGSAKRAWTRAAGSIQAGAKAIVLRDPPSGWRKGDELAITPTGAPARGHSEAYSYAKVADRSGSTVRLSQPTANAHPEVSVAPGRVYAAEALNLTRNVRIEGTPTGRAHVLIHSKSASHISNVSLRHLGPRQPDGSYTRGVTGRYGLHFHHAGHSTHGSVVQGVVVHDCGNHAFVGHESHGITYRDCISHNTYGEAYWWDAQTDEMSSQSNEVSYLGCVASLVMFDPPFRGYRLAGFSLGHGSDNLMKGCVAVGVQGNKNAAGFLWPESGNGSVWSFEDCVAHNNAVHGLFVWQNSKNLQVIRTLVAYHNGDAGISHGAYRNRFHYEDCLLYGNKVASIRLQASSLSSTPLTFENVRCDGGGISSRGIIATMPNLEALVPTVVKSCSLIGHTGSAVEVSASGAGSRECPQLINFQDCELEGNQFWLESSINSRCELKRLDAAKGSIRLHRADQQGELRAEWNARVQSA